MPKLPEDATPAQRMERWSWHVMRNPSACAFLSDQFVIDMQQKGIVEAFARWVPWLLVDGCGEDAKGWNAGLPADLRCCQHPPLCCPSAAPAGCAHASRPWPMITALRRMVGGRVENTEEGWWRGGAPGLLVAWRGRGQHGGEGPASRMPLPGWPAKRGLLLFPCLDALPLTLQASPLMRAPCFPCPL